MRRDRMELNPDLLYLISRKLETFSNIIRFRSVCKQWRLAVDPADCPPRLPWIMHRVTPSSVETNRNDFTVYSLSSSSTSRITLPIRHQEYKHGMSGESSFGFLIIQDSVKTPYLFNPFTESTFHFPFSKGSHFMIYIGPQPNNNSSTVKYEICMVICRIFKGEAEIGFWNSQNNEFTSFRIPIVSFSMRFYKGKLFVYSIISRETTVYEMTTGADLNIVIPNPVEHLLCGFLVEAMGDLLWVALSSEVVNKCYNFKFGVYRLDHTEDFGQCRWIKLKGIGDRMLFLTDYRATGFCLSSSAFNGLRGNCIYYLISDRLVRCNMEDGTTDELLKLPSSDNKWFMPCLI